jgi:hypothetical protein
VLPVFQVDQRDTHRLIPAQFADNGDSVLSRLTDDDSILDRIFELDNATNDRLLAESGELPGMDVRELVFGIPSYRIINAAFCHPSPNARFNGVDRGVWYAGFELESSQREVAYHRQLWLREIAWQEEEVVDYLDYLADFRAEFHDLRRTQDHVACLAPDSYAASQKLAAELLKLGSSGIVYPSVRHAGGTCIACFRPVLVGNVRKGRVFTFTFPDCNSAPSIWQA